MNDALWWTDKDGTMHERCLLIFSTQEIVEYDPGEFPGMWQRASMAFFCSHCGDVWDRILVRNSRKEVMPFELFQVACWKHWDAYNVPGSILVSRLEGLLRVLPLEMLKREFVAHLKYADKGIELERTCSTLEPDGSQGSLGGPDWDGQDVRDRLTG